MRTAILLALCAVALAACKADTDHSVGPLIATEPSLIPPGSALADDAMPMDTSTDCPGLVVPDSLLDTDPISDEEWDDLYRERYLENIR